MIFFKLYQNLLLEIYERFFNKSAGEMHIIYDTIYTTIYAEV